MNEINTNSKWKEFSGRFQKLFFAWNQLSQIKNSIAEHKTWEKSSSYLSWGFFFYFRSRIWCSLMITQGNWGLIFIIWILFHFNNKSLKKKLYKIENANFCKHYIEIAVAVHLGIIFSSSKLKISRQENFIFYISQLETTKNY